MIIIEKVSSRKKIVKKLIIAIYKLLGKIYIRAMKY